MSAWHSQRTRALGLLAWLAVACGAGPETLRLVGTTPVGLGTPAAFRQAVLQGERTRAPRGEPLAMAVGASADELIAARLDRPPGEARLWRAEFEVSAAPLIVPGLVLFGAKDEVVALSADAGQRAWAVPARGATLLAAAREAELHALLLGDRSGRRWISIYDRTHDERARVTAEASLGTPALLGTTLLVPFGDGELIAVDVGSVAELGRARVADAPVHALWSQGSLFFGGPPWFELAQDEAEPYALPRRPLPSPVQSGPVYPTAAQTPDVTRLYVRPRPPTGREPNDVYLVTFGRIAFGLGRGNGSLQWVVALPGRALSAAAAADGFVVCDDSGTVRLLAAGTGQSEAEWPLLRQRRLMPGEAALRACALSVDGPVRAATDGVTSQPPEPLLEQLASVLSLSDPDLAEAQRFLSRELAARPEPEATRVLIELVTRHSLDRVLQSEAEDLLATRRNGQDYMLAALSDASAAGKEALPPIAPLGEALAALDERRAAPALARQLNRPAHTASAIARAAAALELLASEAEYAELSVFFSLHRTNADGPEWVAAVVSSARTLLRVGGPRAQALLQFATRDPLTVPEVRSAIEEALAAGTSARTGY